MADDAQQAEIRQLKAELHCVTEERSYKVSRKLWACHDGKKIQSKSQNDCFRLINKLPPF